MNGIAFARSAREPDFIAHVASPQTCRGTRRSKPVAMLMLLAPLIAAYLPGGLSFAQLGLFPAAH